MHILIVTRKSGTKFYNFENKEEDGKTITSLTQAENKRAELIKKDIAHEIQKLQIIYKKETVVTISEISSTMGLFVKDWVRTTRWETGKARTGLE